MNGLRWFLAFLLSAHAVAGAMLLAAPEVAGFAVGAIAGAAALGALLEPSAASGLDRAWRWPATVTVWAVYMMVLMVTIVSAMNPGILDPAMWVQLLAVFQGGFLLFAGWGRGFLGVHHNALALVAVAVLGGSLPAAAAVCGYAALVAAWLVIDHYGRRGAGAGAACIPALGSALAVAAILAVAFVLLPPTPYEPLWRVMRAEASREASASDLWELVVYGAGAAGVVAVSLMLLWWFRRRRDKAHPRPLGEVEVGRGKLQRRVLVPRVGGDAPGWRGRVVRLYVEFLRSAESEGFQREPPVTPAEFAARLPGPARELATVFERARYSDAEITERDFRDAEGAAGETLGALSRR